MNTLSHFFKYVSVCFLVSFSMKGMCSNNMIKRLECYTNNTYEEFSQMTVTFNEQNNAEIKLTTELFDLKTSKRNHLCRSKGDFIHCSFWRWSGFLPDRYDLDVNVMGLYNDKNSEMLAFGRIESTFLKPAKVICKVELKKAKLD